MLRLPCISILLIASFAQASTPLYQSSFGAGRDWNILRGTATEDAAVAHAGNSSLRVESNSPSTDAAVGLPRVALTLGKRYELSGWIRTEDLAVRDLDRSPIASGATITMASMPFDVHTTSVAGTQPWTRVSMKFIASASQDHVLLTVGNGGSFSGRAWFEGIRLEEIPSGDEWPVADAVQTYGPAYRYPAAGWIYLHIEGKPYERGYQHGHLMAREIPEYLDRCAAVLGDKEHWKDYRTSANALFLRGFDQEILEEMRGIADGASDAGARWQDRKIDLVDIVVANVTVELGELASAVETTATGLEGLDLEKPAYAKGKRDAVTDHCSAFAATGPATRDGKMVIGHVTWWPLTLAEQTNVMLDIKPAEGHRVLMQSYPGGIESGTDWYQNDAGVVLTETTIDQTPFNMQGTPVAFRARTAIQYGGNIDEVVERLGTRNNGLYTNEWIVGDAKTNEIAMLDLGTNHTKLWRSSKNEWFGDTPGFYWGDNNAKDLTVRLEVHSDPQGNGGYIPYLPYRRDRAWTELYQKYKGQIGEQFGFLAFRTAPLVSAYTVDAKVVTSEMASHMMVWAAFGKPNQREWVPRKSDYAKNDGLYSSGYYLFQAEPTASLQAIVGKNEAARVAAAATSAAKPASSEKPNYKDRVWKGWVLPASDADTWFVAGAASYRRVLLAKDPQQEMDARRATWRRVQLTPDAPGTPFRREMMNGVLFLDALRLQIGDEAFFKLMNDYFAANTTKTVTAQSFLDRAGVDFRAVVPPDGAAYVASDIEDRLGTAVIVYGTLKDAGANRYAAEQLQSQFLDQFESRVPIYKDFEASDELLQAHDVIFVGRPEANSAATSWSGKLEIAYPGASFKTDGKTYASERNGLIVAAKNPLNPSRMVLLVGGNSALTTVKLVKVELPDTQYVIQEESAETTKGFVGVKSGWASKPASK
jgi:hypothetical protein